MGMIYKRGRLYWIKYYRNGKYYRESTKSQKEADAKRLLKKREGEISEGKLPGIYFDKVVYEELRSEILTDYELNGRKSLNRLMISLTHLDAHFNGMKAVSIDSPEIKRYIDKRLSEGAANPTINRELSALTRMFSLGKQCTPPIVHNVPFIPKLNEGLPRQGFVEVGDFLKIRDNLPDYLQDFCTFAYRTGWRLSEITNLTLDRVDLNQGIVTLNPGETKNDEGRIVYLDDELREVIQRQLEARKQAQKILPYVFLNKDKTDRIKYFRKAWATACIKAGFWAWDEEDKREEEKRRKVPTRLFHDLRRSAIRNLIRSGVSERVAMHISGHKTRSVFERYNIVSDADLRIAAQKQAIYLESQMGTISGTIEDFEEKKEAINSDNPLISLVPPA